MKLEKSVILVNKNLKINMLKIKKIIKLGTIVVIQVNVEMLQIPIVFHNVSKYDYHSNVKELAEEREQQFNCVGENNKKCVTFTVQIEKEVARSDKNGKEITKMISYRLQFIDSARFMASSLWNLVNNVPEGIHKIKCVKCIKVFIK